MISALSSGTLNDMTSDLSTLQDEAAEEAAREARSRLLELRASIDNLDSAVVHLLAERFKCTQQVGRLKAEHGMPAVDSEREAVQIKRLRSLAEEARLDPEFAEKFLNFIIDEVVRNHRNHRAQ